MDTFIQKIFHDVKRFLAYKKWLAWASSLVAYFGIYVLDGVRGLCGSDAIFLRKQVVSLTDPGPYFNLLGWAFLTQIGCQFWLMARLEHKVVHDVLATLDQGRLSCDMLVRVLQKEAVQHEEVLDFIDTHHDALQTPHAALRSHVS